MNAFLKVPDLGKYISAEADKIDKAMRGALYTATYYLYKQSWLDTKRGNLGLPGRVVLTSAKDKLARLAKKGPALGELYKGILYLNNMKNLTGTVGFIGTDGVQAVMRRLAEKHKGGYFWPYTEHGIRAMHIRGVHPRKGTTGGNVPARDIMGAISGKYDAIVLEKLQDSFDRKMRGERT